jgi:3-oxoacyl-[acyl-carrier-protein] synthase-1
MELVAAGMTCCVGLNAAAACAAMRAGISLFAELPYLDNSARPIIGASVPDLDQKLKSRERVAEILFRALSDCLAQSPRRWQEVPLIVGLAEPERPGGTAELASSIVAQMESRLDVRFHPRFSCAFPTGHTAGFEALRQARELLEREDVPACLICGADSYINAPALLWLDRLRRLKTVDNSDGVIPGEAAVAILVQREGESRDSSAARITGLGFATEEVHVCSTEPLLAHGLSQAAAAALAEAGTQMHEVDFRISDVTGEGYGFKEQSLTLSRLLRQRRTCLPLWHAADSIGDTGAAAGICELVVGMHAFQKRYAPGDRAACYTSSVPGGRAVAVLERVNGRQRG